MEELLKKIRNIIEDKMKCSAHNLDHTDRVLKMCKHLVWDYPGADFEILEIAALLHDIARHEEDNDTTGKVDHAVMGASVANEILNGLNYPKDKIKKVEHCILTHRYRENSLKPKSIEAKILFDADKLDVLGAIGIARAYMIAGQYGERVFVKKDIDKYIEENLAGGVLTGRIKEIKEHSPNLEFETKFKHIPERLFTKRARIIAQERLEYMKKYFEKIKDEIYE